MPLSREVEPTPIKLFSRQVTEESATSEPNQEPRNRLSNAQSNNSWADPEDTGESINPKSEYTDDHIKDSEDKHLDEVSDKKSFTSQSNTSSHRNSQKSEHKKGHQKFVKNPAFKEQKYELKFLLFRNEGFERQNPYYRNNYNDFNYFQKSSDHTPSSFKNWKNMKKRGENYPKGNSYQVYKRELRDQK